MIRSYFGDDFEFGERYGYYSKKECFLMAQEAKSIGYDVRFGKEPTAFCSYYFEIVDPWEDSNT